MGSINTNDIIFASIVMQGRQVASYSFSGLATPAEILAWVRRAAAGLIGLATVKLRNYSQGWSHTAAMRLTGAPEGTQLTLF